MIVTHCAAGPISEPVTSCMYMLAGVMIIPTNTPPIPATSASTKYATPYTVPIADPTVEPAAALPIPATYRAAHVLRAEDKMCEGVPSADKDPRTSLHIGEVPTPEPATDAVYLHVMASSINFNTVWTSIFEPLPTFAFLDRLGRESVWGARHARDFHVVGSDASAGSRSCGGRCAPPRVPDGAGQGSAGSPATRPSHLVESTTVVRVETCAAARTWAMRSSRAVGVSTRTLRM